MNLRREVRSPDFALYLVFGAVETLAVLGWIVVAYTLLSP
jgi:hypothetical protein